MRPTRTSDGRIERLEEGAARIIAAVEEAARAGNRHGRKPGQKKSSPGDRPVDTKAPEGRRCPDCTAERDAARIGGRLVALQRAADLGSEITASYGEHPRVFIPIRVERHHRENPNEPCTINVIATQIGGRTSDPRVKLPALRAFRASGLEDISTADGETGTVGQQGGTAAGTERQPRLGNIDDWPQWAGPPY